MRYFTTQWAVQSEMQTSSTQVEIENIRHVECPEISKFLLSIVEAYFGNCTISTFWNIEQYH